jgi:hypothetical protein
MLYLVNSFSLNMMDEMEHAQLFVRMIDRDQVVELLQEAFVPAIGHANTAELVGDILFPNTSAFLFNRTTVAAKSGDQLIVAQYRGPRLPEGQVFLPNGASIQFYLVEVE